MENFNLNLKLKSLDTVSELFDLYNIEKDDLLISSRSTYEQFIKPLSPACPVIFPAKYGTSEPTSEMIDAIYADVPKDTKRIFAIGGGSVIDIAKILTLEFSGSCEGLFMSTITPTKIRSLIAVPTTCGTGSEVTGISVCELTKLQTKKGINLDILVPDDAVLIPCMLENLPYKVFATSSIDAFVHAAESFVSPKASFISKMFSQKAIEMLLTNYKYISETDLSNWNKFTDSFLLASNLAGIAFANGGCAAVHALSYPLGGKYHIPHGEANQLMFAEVFRMYKSKAPVGVINEFEQVIANTLGVSSENALEALVSLLDKILERKPLESYGITTEELSDFSQSVLDSQQRLMSNNYIELTFDDILSIYKSSY